MTNAAFAWAREQQARMSRPDDPPHPGGEAPVITALKAEASFRSFYRLATPRASVVLMISPPERERNAAFESLARIFASAGIPVPDILASNPAEGWYLLTDLGDRDLKAAYGTAAEGPALSAAIDTLVRLQTVRHAAIAPYTTARFADELGIFSEWFAGRLLGLEVPSRVEPVFADLVGRTQSQRQCCVHRDYHCRNLLFDPATGRFGVVDFQDALVGPVSYDLASLLHDCYHEFADADVATWTARFLAETPFALDPERFVEDLAYMAVQRQLKAVGIFARLKLRDGRATHLEHIPPVLAHLCRLTRQHAALAPLADWLGSLDDARVRQTLAALVSSERDSSPSASCESGRSSS